MSYEVKILLFWITFFITILCALFIYNTIYKFRFRKWKKDLIKYGEIQECDVKEFIDASSHVPHILSNLQFSDKQDLDEFMYHLEDYGYEAGFIILSLMADQYKDYMSPLSQKFANRILCIVGDRIDKAKFEQWEMDLPLIEKVNSYASGWATFLFFLPPKLEKKTMNPMHKWIAKQQKEDMKIMKRLKKEQCRY